MKKCDQIALKIRHTKMSPTAKLRMPMPLSEFSAGINVLRIGPRLGDWVIFKTLGSFL
jgi:hypothetical protein